ncbi:hypothetical protein K502DRAFT_348826 [Neoconidiobolus thromboides FSU 785]|nr:hypothetical protein K502DRAFT_348826 [Neoconidiobolus thromboides FSU 785]
MFQKPNNNNNNEKKGFKSKFNAKKVQATFKVKGFEKEEAKPIETVELIKGFNGNEVESLAPPKVEKGPLVIPFSGKEAAWKKKIKTYVPEELINRGETATHSTLNVEEKERKFGLNVSTKSKEVDTTTVEEEIEISTVKVEEISLEEQARRELMKEVSAEKQVKVGVIPMKRTEDEAFKEEYENAPEENTLEDYEDVPIEEFGAALLRGMGWKDGESIGLKKSKE